MNVIKKICEVIDGEYVCDIDISVEEWKTLLTNDNHKNNYILTKFSKKIKKNFFIK